VEVLGHRGSRDPGPENSVAAVDAALAAGADGVEIDVRRSADGELVVVHDARLPRLGGRAVLRRSTAELGARGVPTLHDVLDVWAGRGRIIIEIKNQPGQPDFDAPRERTAQVLVEVLRARGLTGPDAGVTVSSFDWFAIERVRAAGLEVPTGFLTMPRMAVSGGLAYVRSAGHRELHAHTSAVLAAPNAAELAHRAGVRLVTWTVTSDRAALRLRDAGVDAVICDAPADVARALRSTTAAEPAPSGPAEA
jgi:glycerophosphoryl diester phosphodiesterase